MAETPDFDKIATRIIEGSADIETGGTFEALAESRIADALRLVWNARGAADMATIEHDLSTMMGASAAGPYLKNLERALRKLDR